MNEIKFSIPWINDLKYLQGIIADKNCKIYEVFYRPNDLLLGGWKESSKILKYLRENNISLAMTATQRSGIFDFSKSFKEYLDETKIIPDRMIVDYSSIDTVANNEVIKDNKIKLYISAIVEVKTLDDVKKLIDLKKKYPLIDTVCLHHDCTKDENLKAKVDLLKEHDIESILLVNESCYLGCPYRADHYSYISTKFNIQQDPYQMFCVKNRLKQKNIFDNLAGYINPKGVVDYQKKFGVDHFKISGQPSSDRKRTTKESEKTVNAYLFGKIPENLFEIITFTYLKHPISNVFRLNGSSDDNIQRIDQFTEEENILYDDFLKMIRIDNVYKKYGDHLPWVSAELPIDIRKELDKVSRSEKIIVVGCGLGQHLAELIKMGFKDIWATDLSGFAISEVRKKYPIVKSFSCPTEDLYKYIPNDFVVLDIHNLHQVNPIELKEYLASLKKISSKIILSWIYEPEKGEVVKSDISELGSIYNHNIETVEKLLTMNKVDDFNYEMANNQDYFRDNKKHINRMIGGVFINKEINAPPPSNSRHKRAWMGIGISNEYVPVLQNLGRTIVGRGYSELMIIIADKIDQKYNRRERKELTDNLFELASKVAVPDCKIQIVSYEFLLKNKKYLEILKKYQNLFENDSIFKNEVVSLVKQNRQGLKDDTIARAAGYVLEEISAAVFFKEIDYIKIGPDEKEKDFDNLIMEFSGLADNNFNRF